MSDGTGPSVETLLGLSPMHLVAGLLIFIRVLGIFTSAPVFGHAHVPPQVKICLALLISLILLPLLPGPDPVLLQNTFLLVAAGVKELAVGLVIGFIATLVFLAIQLAGEAADTQVGFGMASIADPMFGNHTSIIGQFQYIIATLLFLAVNGHHLVLEGLVRSFQLVPLGDFALHSLLTGRVLDITSNLFIVGMRIGGPVMLSVFLTDLGLGLLGRTAPQLNLMTTGMPIKIFVGFAMLMVSVPFFILICQDLFTTMYQDILTVVQAM